MGRLKITDRTDWEVAVVYANKDRHTRRTVWDDISKYHTMGVPLLIGGDFNCIMAQAEKKGGKAFHFSPAAGDMADFMLTNDLVDPGFNGPSFTWTNNKDARSSIFSRLDRFLVSSSILDVFQGLKVKHLTRLASDHCPILCCLMEDVKKASYHWIKFEDVWAS
ncbi:threonine dehydratase [Dendrobium catenatum]|uniref:Threonine dehydratase n=1 Tax=Dendrobium catenatum TaxID=906689 RepID=A0A2I0VCA1_9ASPA|nr:threonine dehydratase [Dendrobium catenatum]